MRVRLRGLPPCFQQFHRKKGEANPETLVSVGIQHGRWGDLIISAIVPPEEFSVILLIGGPGGAGDGNAREWKNLDALDGADENSSQ
jgi:hypothetical protein